MNPDNGHLVDLSEMTKEQRIQWLKLNPSYLPVEEQLQNAAKLKLAGEKEAYVSMHSGGKLSKWATKQRRLRKKKNRMQKQSRKKNR